jgi:hypothetical protein
MPMVILTLGIVQYGNARVSLNIFSILIRLYHTDVAERNMVIKAWR